MGAGVEQVTAVPAQAGTGRVLGPVRAVLMVVEARWTWYRRNWRASVVSSVVEPVLFLLAVGFGLGSQIQPAEATGGLSYVVYLAPALIVVTAVQVGAFESTYPVLAAFKWQRTFLAFAATPVTPAQILGGQLTWIATRMAVSGGAYLLIAALLGALTGPGVLLTLPVAVLTGMAFAAPIVAYTATLETEGNRLTALFRFVVMPMMLFAGAFFPVEQLPGWLRPVAWVTPLWHGVELGRGAAFGTLRWWPVIGHLGYLAAMVLTGAWLAARVFRRRLGQ